MTEHVGKGDKQLNPLSQHYEKGSQVEKVGQHCYGVTEMLQIMSAGSNKLLLKIRLILK